MRHELRRIFRFGIVLGLGLGIGCSDEGGEPSAGSTAGRTSGPGSSTPASIETPSTPGPSTTPSKTPPLSPGNADQSPSVGQDAPVVLSDEALVAGGRSVYNANCIACHSMDPTKDGALGPAVAGSPLELLETRVLRGEYPKGYEPKRATRVMIPLPHLEPRLAELAAYLNSLD